eukprot:Sspe_Gene.18984::Locus_6879_Transcript_1_1_Confidence_1.000_Length_1392::g.18984::m.18984
MRGDLAQMKTSRRCRSPILSDKLGSPPETCSRETSSSQLDMVTRSAGQRFLSPTPALLTPNQFPFPCKIQRESSSMVEDVDKTPPPVPDQEGQPASLASGTTEPQEVDEDPGSEASSVMSGRVLLRRGTGRSSQHAAPAIYLSCPVRLSQKNLLEHSLDCPPLSSRSQGAFSLHSLAGITYATSHHESASNMDKQDFLSQVPYTQSMYRKPAATDGVKVDWSSRTEVLRMELAEKNMLIEALKAQVEQLKEVNLLQKEELLRARRDVTTSDPDIFSCSVRAVRNTEAQPPPPSILGSSIATPHGPPRDPATPSQPERRGGLLSTCPWLSAVAAVTESPGMNLTLVIISPAYTPDAGTSRYSSPPSSPPQPPSPIPTH